jgi:hypothetical protein
VGLPAGGRVGELDAGDHERVVLPGGGLHRRLAHAVAGVLERVLAVADAQAHVLGRRRPHAELRFTVAGREGAETALEGVGAGHLARSYP